MPHEAEAKVSGAHILLKPASAGTGLIAGGVVRTILEVAGVNNALSKSLGQYQQDQHGVRHYCGAAKLVPAKDWVTKGCRKPRRKRMPKPRTQCREPRKLKPTKAAGNRRNMKYNELRINQTETAKRVGRGIAAGQGKTAGRGTKGQEARTGSSNAPGFAGGQNPLMQRLPKLPGFRSHQSKPKLVYTGQLDQFACQDNRRSRAG